MIGTVLVHAIVAALLFTQVRSSRAMPPSYAVELVAAPAPTPKQRLAREAVPTPPPVEKPAPVKPQPPKPSKSPPAPVPKPQPRDSNREPPPRTAAPVTPVPGETPSTGTDVANIKTPGLEFPYPEYLRNIVTQVYRNWDRGSARENSYAEIAFMISRDGAVRNIHFVTRSGSFAFDLSAQGAIEASGNSGAFGPLPDGWEADVLPVSFYFKPTSR
jgi:outer membrane biosynthesis protein TonB